MKNVMKTIGIIGGLGPMATVYFMELVTKMVNAAVDQEHPRILLASIPDTPDRTAFILKQSVDNPLDSMLEAGKKLADMGADFIAIPCVTAQYFYHELTEKLPIPVLSLTDIVVEYILVRGIGCIGLLATRGTIQSGILEKKLQAHDINVILPNAVMQEKVMEMIYQRIKKGADVPKEELDMIAEDLIQCGAKKILLGCTELSLLKKEFMLGKNYLDVLEMLAQKTVVDSGAKLKCGYESI